MLKMAYPNYLNEHVRKNFKKGRISKESRLKGYQKDQVLRQPQTASNYEDIQEEASGDIVDLNQSRNSKEKLKVMENKLEKLSEYLNNVIKEQNYLRSELMTAQNEARSLKWRLKLTKKDLEISERHRSRLEAEIECLREMTEAAVIDKEIAEEKTEYFEEIMKDECEKTKSLEIELEILREEMQIQSDNGVPAIHHLNKLKDDNSVLNNAILRLNNLYHNLQERFQKAKEEATVCSGENETLKEIAEYKDKTIFKLKEEVDELSETLDNILSADELVFEVTARNLRLEAEIRQLRKKMQVMEEELEVSEEIEEALQEIKLICREEIECLESKLKNAETVLLQYIQLLKDKEKTINQYRELTAGLREKNHKLSNELETALRQKNESIVSVENLKLKIGAQNRLEISDLIRNESLKIDLSSVKDELNYFSLFMPENFFTREGENSAIQVRLITAKILKKLKLLIVHLQSFLFERYDKDPTELSSLNTSTKFLILAYELECLLKMCAASFHQMDVKNFLAQGRYHYTIMQIDSDMNSYLVLLCNKELDKKNCLVSLKKAYSSLFEILNSNFVPKFEETTSKVELSLSIIHINSKYINAFCSALDAIGGLLHDYKLKAIRASCIAQGFKRTTSWLLKYIKNCREENLYLVPAVADNVGIISKSVEEVLSYFTTIYTKFQENQIADSCFTESTGKQSFNKIISAMEKINKELEDLKISGKNGDFFIEATVKINHLSPIDILTNNKKKESEEVISNLVNKVASCELEIISLTETLQKQKCESQERVKAMQDSAQQTEEIDTTTTTKDVLSAGDCSATTDFLMLQLQDMECSMKYLNQKNFELRISIIKQQQNCLVPLRILPKPKYLPDLHSICTLQRKLNKLAGIMRGIMVPLVIDITKKRNNKERFYKYLTNRMIIRREVEDELWKITSEIRDLRFSPRTIWSNVKAFPSDK